MISLLVLQDGSVFSHFKSWATKAGRWQKESHIETLKSVNQGRSWRRSTPLVARRFNFRKEWIRPGNPHSIQLKNGRILSAFRVTRTIKKNKNRKKIKRVFSLRLFFSDDNGKSWHFLSTIARRPHLTRGLWEPFLIKPSGIKTLQVYYARERKKNCWNVKGDGQDIVMRESLDDGVTWGRPRVVFSRGVSREGVPSIVELVDGSLLAVFESWRANGCVFHNAHLTIGMAQSNDHGRTWVYRNSAYVPTNKEGTASWPYIIKLADGRVLLKFASDRDYIGKPKSKFRLPNGKKKRRLDLMLLASGNIPTFNNPPIWARKSRKVFRNARWGSIAQARNGNVFVAASGFRQVRPRPIFRGIKLHEIN